MLSKMAPVLAAKILQALEDSGGNKTEVLAALNAALALAPSCLTSFGPVVVVPLKREDAS